MPVLGLHSAQYKDLIAPIPKHGRDDTIGPATQHRDITNATFRHPMYLGQATFNLYPKFGLSSENWGTVAGCDAVIMPFEMVVMQQGLMSITQIELDLLLTTSDPNTSEEAQGAAETSDMRPQGKAYFLRIPAPRELASCPRTCYRRQEARHRPSLIRGTTVTDPDSLLSYEAKWMWTANGHEPQSFYGAVVLCYPAQRFWITCRIRGQAACFPFWYTFSDESFERRRFALEQPPAAHAVGMNDIEDQMNRLDAKMAMLNTGDDRGGC